MQCIDRKGSEGGRDMVVWLQDPLDITSAVDSQVPYASYHPTFTALQADLHGNIPWSYFFLHFGTKA